MSKRHNEPSHRFRVLDHHLHHHVTERDRSSTSGMVGTASGSYLAALLASVSADHPADRDDDSADSILEDHVSRVWVEEEEEEAPVMQSVQNSTAGVSRNSVGSVVASRDNLHRFPSGKPVFSNLLQTPHRNRVINVNDSGADCKYQNTGSRVLSANGRNLMTFQDLGDRKDRPVNRCASFCGTPRISTTTFLQCDLRNRLKYPDDCNVASKRPAYYLRNECLPLHRPATTCTDTAKVNLSTCKQYNDWEQSFDTRRTKPQPQGNGCNRTQLKSSSLIDSSNESRLNVFQEKSVFTDGDYPTSCCPQSTDVTIVGYFMCEDPIPYRTTLPGKHPTLGQFKQLLTKKGNLRFFFRKASDEFDSGVVHEEITDDSAVLPLWEGKIVGKIELMQ